MVREAPVKDGIADRLIEHIHSTKAEEIFELSLNGEVISATGEHPFFDAENNTWVRTKELTPGIRFLNSDGAMVKLAGIITVKKRCTVYNITVNPNHNYFVGKSRVLVHNK